MTTNWAAYVGIDWADRQHAVCVIGPLGTCEHLELEQSPEALDEWVSALRNEFGDQPIAVCLEQSRGGLIYALMKYERLTLFPINPKQLARFREALHPSGSKDDPNDAALLAEFLRSHEKHIRPWKPDDADTRTLRLLSESRRRLVDERTALGNQLRQSLKDHFPQALELNKLAMYVGWFLRLLVKFPSLAEMKRANPTTLTRFLPKLRKTVDENGPDPRITLIRQAQPLVTDSAILCAGRLLVFSLAERILKLNEHIEKYEAELEIALAKHPEAPLFASLPGAGEALQPRLIAAFGTDRERYSDAAELQQFSGIAPVTQQSGQHKQVRRRRACSKFLRQTFQEYADHSRKKSRWAMAYYQKMRAKGVRHHAALRSLAFKWIRIIFQCWKQRVPYSEAQYMQRLTATNSPILKYLAPESQNENA